MNPAPTPEPETRIERRGRAGWITLNRPRALNALTLGMVREIAVALDAFEIDPQVELVVIAGAGERAFCAGGDVRWLYDHGRAHKYAEQAAFWREEYILDRRVKRFRKPFVALIDGIVMGGGVGVSINGAYRVVGDKALFAMPEVGIGLFPDVGGTWFLPRVPRRLGGFLALTGLSIRSGDMVALGLGTSYTPSAQIADLAQALAFGSAPVDATLQEFSASPPAAPLWAASNWIERALGTFDPAAIRTAIDRAAHEGAPFAVEARDALGRKSPTSQAIALEQMELGAALEFEEALRFEFRIVSRVARGHDFYEGVRAIIVDKDNAPLWRPRPGEPIGESDIAAYFAPLPADEELRFP